MKEDELRIKNDDCLYITFALLPPPKIIMFDLIIDEHGVEYKGEKIEDAGKIYHALRKMLFDQGYYDP